MLELRNITKIYSGTVALSNVSIKLSKGEVQGIIGKNGAGKTTLVGIMSGIIQPTEGKIILNNNTYKSLSRQRARREGIGIVTQEAEVIPDWTVAENLFMPDFVCSWDRQTIKWNEMYAQAELILNKNNVLIGAHEKVKDLTIGEQQLLLIMKACYVEDARIIILDEVTTALSKTEEEHLYHIIDEQKKLGKTIIFISHRMDEVLRICDSVTVIKDGTVIATERREDLDDEKLSAFIVGTAKSAHPSPVDGTDQKNGREHREKLLSIEGLSRKGLFEDITFSLYRGEVIGFAGLRGSGRTEIFRAIAGLEPADDGSISVGDNGKHKFKSPDQAIRKGIVYLTENRDKDGIIDILSVKSNLTLSALRSISKAGFIHKKKEAGLSKRLMDLLSIHTPSYNEMVRNLSGGNRQKVMLGKIIAVEPLVYLLDEPTKGIDISAKRDILEFVRRELTKTSGIILTLPEIPSLIEVSDIIFALYKRKIVARFVRSEFNEAAIYNAIQGVGKKSEIPQP